MLNLTCTSHKGRCILTVQLFFIKWKVVPIRRIITYRQYKLPRFLNCSGTKMLRWVSKFGRPFLLQFITSMVIKTKLKSHKHLTLESISERLVLILKLYDAFLSFYSNRICKPDKNIQIKPTQHQEIRYFFNWYYTHRVTYRLQTAIITLQMCNSMFINEESTIYMLSMTYTNIESFSA